MSRSKLFIEDLFDAGGLDGFGPAMPDFIEPSRPTLSDDFAARKTRERVAAIKAETNAQPQPAPRPKRPSARVHRENVTIKATTLFCRQCGGPLVIETTNLAADSNGLGGGTTRRYCCARCNP